AGGHVAGVAPVLRPRRRPCSNAGARGAGGRARPDRPARARPRAWLATVARDPGRRLVDGRDAGPERAGSPRPAASRRSRAAQARRAPARRRRSPRDRRGAPGARLLRALRGVGGPGRRARDRALRERPPAREAPAPPYPVRVSDSMASTREVPAGSAAASLDPAPGERVLVVEDEPGIVDFVSRGLAAEGYSVQAAFDGVEGERLALSGEFDAVVLDLMLPGRDGMEVLRTLRKAAPRLPVIVLTARAEIEDRVEGLDAGAADYLVKPFSMAEL